MTPGGLLHIALHFVVPAVFARLAYPARWRTAWLVLAAAIVVDVDHLLADPVYDPGRCSVGYHPLHTLPAVLGYAALLLPGRTRLLGIGLVLHMVLDALDCVGL